jgi:gamma-tubulin complex component 5
MAYVVDIVLIPCSQRLFERIQNSEDVDEMTEIHDEFVSNTHARCLLSKNLGPIQNAILSVLEIAVQFADHQLHQAGKGGRGRANHKSRKKTPLRAMAARRSPKAESIYVADESTDEGGDQSDDGDYDADTENLSGSAGSHADKLKAMREELTRLRVFIVKGLRGISRSGGEFAWEILADHLDFVPHV